MVKRLIDSFLTILNCVSPNFSSMVDITLSFLLGFEDKSIILTGKNYRKSKTIKVSEKISTISQRSKKTSSTGIIRKINQQKQSVRSNHSMLNAIPTGCNINFLITPTQMVHVSVAVVGNVAKICTKNEIVAAKVLKLQNTQFVAFSISHRVPSPENFFEIGVWLDHKIEFWISENPADLLPRINQIDQFDLAYRNSTASAPHQIEFESVTIVEDHNPVSSPTRNGTDHTSISPVNSDLQAVPSLLHLNTIKKAILTNASILSAIDIDESTKTKLEKPKKDKKKVKGKGSIKNPMEGKTSSNATPVAVISGQKILYDKRTWTETKFKLSQQISVFQLWLTTKNIISEKLRNETLPLGIYTKNIINFPKIDDKSLSRIVLKYNMGDLITDLAVMCSKTASHSCKKIVFDDVQFLFLGGIPLLKIIENLQTNKLVVEIFCPICEGASGYSVLPSRQEMSRAAKRLVNVSPEMDTGNKIKSGKVFQSAFNRKSTLKSEEKFIVQKKSRTISDDSKLDFDKLQLLGYAEIDCSNFAADGFRLETNVNLSQYNSQEKVSVDHVIQHFDLSSVHEDIGTVKKGAIENGRFIHCNSFLQIGIQLSGLPRLASLERINLFDNLFKRAVVLTHEKRAVLPILRRIFELNAKILSYKDMEIPWVPYWFARDVESKEEAYPAEEHPCLITGFSVEFSNVTVLVIEGLNDYTFPQVVLDVVQLPAKYGRVLFDDQLIFTERLYKDFEPYGGFYSTATQINIDELLRRRNAILTCNIPIPAMRVAHKLCRLISCPSLRNATMERLFPTVSDLLSFNAEFGVPFTYKAGLNFSGTYGQLWSSASFNDINRSSVESNSRVKV